MTINELINELNEIPMEYWDYEIIISTDKPGEFDQVLLSPHYDDENFEEQMNNTTKLYLCGN